MAAKTKKKPNGQRSSAALKTTPTRKSVSEYLAALPESQQNDCKKLKRIFSRVTGKRPVMWGDSIVGYGRYRYRRADGSEHEFLRTGFSARKTSLVLYILPGYTDHAAKLKRLGKHSLGKACLYIKRLSDIDEAVLEELVTAGWQDMAKKYP